MEIKINFSQVGTWCKKNIIERGDKALMRAHLDDKGFHYDRKAVAEATPNYYKEAQEQKAKARLAAKQAQLEALKKKLEELQK